MKRNFLVYLCFLSTMFLMSSCFDVVEEIDLNDNGSGKLKMTINLSKSKTKVASLMKLDKMDGIKIPSEKEIRSEANNIAAVMKGTKGISNVKTSLDFTNFIGSISCDFSDVNALNAVMQTLSAKFKNKMSDYSTYAFNSKTKTLTRSYKYTNEGKKELGKLQPENQKSLQDAYFTSIYRFQTTVEKQNNTSAKLSTNKKAVLLKANLLDIVNGKVNMSNTIKLN